MTEYDKKGNEVEIKPGAIFYRDGEYNVVTSGFPGYFHATPTKHPYLTKLGMLIEQKWQWYWTVIIITYIIGAVNGFLLVLLLL